MATVAVTEMEKLMKGRVQVRRFLTIYMGDLEKELQKEIVNIDNVKIEYQKICEKSDRLWDLDQQISEIMLGSESEEKIAEEYEKQELYRNNIVKAKVMYESFVNKEKSSSSGSQQSTSSKKIKRRFRLPELEFKKFSGAITEWLPFWNQFQKIHEDPDIADEDKFQYLSQAMVKGSKAADLVNSYPAVGRNYVVVIQELKARFARDEFLIESYVRELIKLVIGQTLSTKLKLSDLYVKLETQMRALESLGVTCARDTAMLFPLVESSLPEDTLRNWERHKANNSQHSINQLTELMNFIKIEVDSEERVRVAKSQFTDQIVKKRVEKTVEQNPTVASLANIKTTSNCIFCSKNHRSQECYSLQGMTLEERKICVNKAGCCYICLKKGHQARQCRSRLKCVTCKRAHHVILCPGKTTVMNSEPDTQQDQAVGTKNLFAGTNPSVIMQTLVVKLKNKKKEQLARVLMDSGSQFSYILNKTVKDMGYNKEPETVKLRHNLFGGMKSNLTVHERYQISLYNVQNGLECKVNLLSQDTICNSVPRISPCELPELVKSKIVLTDVGPGNTDITILLGADIIPTILTGNSKPVNEMIAMETVLGWTLMGRLESTGVYDTNTLDTMCLKNICSLWETETIGIGDPIEKEKKEEKFCKTVTRFEQDIQLNKEGRFEVKLPWVEGLVPQSNRSLAETRLRNTTKRLVKINKFEEYNKVIQNWVTDGVVEEINEEPQDCDKPTHYLPHRPVFKPGSSTPVRPVFDASCKDWNNTSLNDCLETGPNYIELIPALLLRFRQKKIGVTSDIRRAFLQISIHESDRDMLRFLWWKENQVKVFRHRRLVFGLTCSPFILAATLNYHLDKISGERQETSQILRQSFYVDNCVTSCDDLSELHKFVNESKSILSEGKFELCQWSHSKFVDEVPVCLDGCEDKNKLQILGITWECDSDLLSCDVTFAEETLIGPVTKRKILSISQKLFDPLGLYSPVTLLPKMLLQECWKQDFKWDEELPTEISSKFTSWLRHLPLLRDYKIKRHLRHLRDSTDCSLHIFCDASKLAYSACAFLRCQNGSSIDVQFLMSKSRVAPVKDVTIPRLELMAAAIGVRLRNFIVHSFDWKFIQSHYWSDSTVVISWIKDNCNKPVFERNRVREILQSCTSDHWHHVSGKSNPADLPSRGCSVEKFVEQDWWRSADWLKQVNLENFETAYTLVGRTSEADIKDNPMFIYFSSYTRTLSMTAWLLRFIHNTRHNPRLTGELHEDEISRAEVVVIRMIQTESKIKERQLTFQTLVDKENIVRVKTRLLNSSYENDFQLPIVLPGDHKMVERLVREYHIYHKHAGVGVLLGKLREKFWICQVRRLARRVVGTCVRCRRFASKAVICEEAGLPRDRVDMGKAFETTGVDLCGPLYLKDNIKSWVVLFTCALYRAVHFELVTSLSTEAFMQALRRFIARRGRVTTIYSDNGTNFTGTNNLLSSLDWSEIERTSTVHRIRWKFIPPAAPWWGGWWERLVRMLKDLLKRNLGRANLGYEEFNTLLCECEAVINSRPLTFVPSTTEDLCPISPAQFLQDVETTAVPDLDKIDERLLRGRLRHLKQVRDNFRQRFKKEYLSTLVHVAKNRQRQRSQIRLGDVVLIGCDNMKRYRWPLGVVTKLYEGGRMVQLKTESGHLIRAVQRLYPLEVHSDYFSTQSETPGRVETTEEVETPEKIETSENAEPQPPEETHTRIGRRIKPIKKMNL